MAGLTLQLADRFPPGTLVGAYLEATLLGSPTGPSIPPVDQATVTSTGALTFQGLAPLTRYVAAASVSGTWRYVRCTSDAATPTEAAAVGGLNHGPFLPQTFYSQNDLVTWSGKAYYANASFTSTAVFDAANWTALPGAQTAANASDVVRGAPDRFYRVIAATLRYDGQSWQLVNEAANRPQNVDGVVSSSADITVDYQTANGVRVASVLAVPNDTLVSSGIRVVTSSTPAQAQVQLVQTKRMSDFAYWNGTAWVLGKGLRSPFALTGLAGTASDFAATVLATANLVSLYRFTEASGAVLTDASPNLRDGAITSTGATFQVAGGLTHEASPKAIKSAAGGTNEFNFALTAFMTQAAFSVEWFGKLDPAATVVFRDGGTTSASGYYVGYSSLNGGSVAYRMGTLAAIATTYPWASLNDGRFHHVVMTKDTVNGALYIDGVLIGSTASAPSTALGSPWRVGRTGHGGTAVTSQAVTMDELAFYARALTLAEVTSHYYAAAGSPILTVTHEDAGDTDLSSISLTSQSVSASPLVSSAAGAIRSSSFDVAFYDAAGNQVQGASTAMRAGIVRSIADRAVNPNALTIRRYAGTGDYTATVLADAPQSYWRLKEDAGALTVSDLAGTNIGTVSATGATLGVTGLLAPDPGTAIQLDGAQGKVEFTNPQITGVMSFEAWFKITGVGSVGTTSSGTLLGWQSVPGPRRILVSATTGVVTVDAGSTTLTTAAGVAPPNVLHHLVFTWDASVEKLYIDGVLVASAPAITAISINNPNFWLGSYIGTSTNYSFKGIIDEVALYTKALSPTQIIRHYAVGINTILPYEAAGEAGISLYGLLEVGTPVIAPGPITPPALPTPTPLPAGDAGGAVLSQVELSTYRSSIDSASGWVKRALPTDSAARNAILINGYQPGATNYAGATSDNWRRSLCTQMGLDPDTPQSQATTNYAAGHLDNMLWLRPGELIYVVPDNQPLLPFTDTDISVAGWAANFNTLVTAIGGLPIPADARPHSTPDRYTFIYQPSKDRTISIYGHMTTDPATTTLTLSGSPSTGGFFVKMLYMDNATSDVREFRPDAYVPYNATAAQVVAMLQTAKDQSNQRAFGVNRPGGYGPSVIGTGGPLNASPIVLTFPLAEALRPVALVITDNFMNSGTCNFTHHNAGPYDKGRLSSMVSPSVDGTVVGGQSIFNGGPFTNRQDGASRYWSSIKWMATATGIDFFGLIPSWEEFEAAQIAGTGLGHVIPMSLGKAQSSPFKYVYPARAGDGLQSTADGSYIPEGARICLPPDVDLSGVIPEFLPVARTLRDHGVITIDKTGGGAEIILRRSTHPTTGTAIANQWLRILPLYLTAGNAAHAYMKSIPWHKIQVIEPTWNA